MAVVIEPTASQPSPFAYDAATALALDSLGLPSAPPQGFVPLPDRLVHGIVTLSGLITGIVWLVRLQGRG
jgi:hypothetical protein